MSDRPRWLILAFGVAMTVAAFSHDARAQRGRGPSEAIRQRSGSYFVEVELPVPDAANGAIALEASAFVKSAVQDGELSLVYLYGPNKRGAKHDQFEQTLFNHAEISTGLRYFRCGRVNLTGNDVALEQFGDKIPLFIAFDGNGVRVGQVAMHDYRAKASPIVKLLERAARKHSKLSLKRFVTKYRKFLKDYQVYEGRKRTLDQKRERLMKKDPRPEAKLAEVDRDDDALEKDKQKLLAEEKKLLELAQVPTRDPKAVRVGQRRRG